MAKRKGRLVVNQEIKDVNASECRSDIHEEDGDQIERASANPDILIDCDENKLWGTGTSPELAGRIIEEFSDGLGNFPVLSKQENMVLRVYLLTGDIDEVGRRLRLSRSSINTYMARTRSKLLRLLKSRDF